MSSCSGFIAGLTIVMQGPLDRDGAPSVAAHCLHWRTIMPTVPLILSISREHQDESPIEVLIAEHHLESLCTSVILAPAAVKLPPVKRGLGDNHVNLQIAAARAGLAAVDTRHVLRIRNDITFVDTTFVDLYLVHRDKPRGAGALLGERVLIAPWFTLDPLTLERLPFHFSDWFHLGRTEDVTALWRVEPMTYRDATWYRRKRYAAGTGAREADFVSRIATEQHVIVAAYARLGRRLPLAFHNDLSGVVESLRLLADDFIVADLGLAPIRFDKYSHLRDAPDMDLVCTMHDTWRALVEYPDADPRQLFVARIEMADALRAKEAAPTRWWRRLTGR